jgi:S-DNA-T family DNA segregation ATPase FtsK/SpoIIIE
VATQADSRVILDVGGAEKLTGKGDMLVVTGESRVPKRLQGVLVEDGEIERIVDFWVNPFDPVTISS